MKRRKPKPRTIWLLLEGKKAAKIKMTPCGVVTQQQWYAALFDEAVFFPQRARRIRHKLPGPTTLRYGIDEIKSALRYHLAKPTTEDTDQLVLAHA